MAELQVTIEGRTVGRLQRDKKGLLRFAYDDDWIAARQATPLSLSLPLRSGWFGHEEMHPYLWGLLPDNEHVLDRWARDFQCSVSDVFGLLEGVGGDVAGAAQYVARGDEPEEGRSGGYDWIDHSAVAGLLREVQRDSTAWHAARDVGMWSLAGAQAKIALAHDPTHGWAIPHGRAPTTHILKPAIAGLANHDLNEFMCVRAAAALGLRAEVVTFGHFDDERALVVERYDRTGHDGQVVRIHQEDFCQALGVHPRSKYESDGGPGFEDLVRVLREAGTAADTDLLRLCDAVAYNWLILGTDAHAKNYSLLLQGRHVRLAPLYDLQSAVPEAKHAPKAKMAQKVGGEYVAGKVVRRHWDRLARSAGIDVDALLVRIDEIAERLPDALADAVADPDLERTERKVAGEMMDAIVSWARRCRSSLGPIVRPQPTPATSPQKERPPQGRKPRGTPQGGQFTRTPTTGPTSA